MQTILEIKTTIKIRTGGKATLADLKPTKKFYIPVTGGGHALARFLHFAGNKMVFIRNTQREVLGIESLDNIFLINQK